MQEKLQNLSLCEKLQSHQSNTHWLSDTLAKTSWLPKQEYNLSDSVQKVQMGPIYWRNSRNTWNQIQSTSGISMFPEMNRTRLQASTLIYLDILHLIWKSWLWKKYIKLMLSTERRENTITLKTLTWLEKD